MNYILSIDPGVETGWALGAYGQSQPYELRASGQIIGGLAGFRRWFSCRPDDRVWNAALQDLICEKFVPLAGEFSFTLDSLEPLRIEGYLIGTGRMPDYPAVCWQRASCQVLMGGKNLAERKRNSDDLLKEHGLWQTGANLERPNANDANSAIKHALWYLKNTLAHEPTLDEYWGED